MGVTRENTCSGIKWDNEYRLFCLPYPFTTKCNFKRDV